MTGRGLALLPPLVSQVCGLAIGHSWLMQQTDCILTISCLFSQGFLSSPHLAEFQHCVVLFCRQARIIIHSHFTVKESACRNNDVCGIKTTKGVFCVSSHSYGRTRKVVIKNSCQSLDSFPVGRNSYLFWIERTWFNWHITIQPVGLQVWLHVRRSPYVSTFCSLCCDVKWVSITLAPENEALIKFVLILPKASFSYFKICQ